MITREDLITSSEYWTEIIQNNIYNDFIEFIEKNNVTNKQLAQSLGLSKGRISQILSGGNLNFRLETIVKLCLTINKIPSFKMLDLDEFVRYDKEHEMRTTFKSNTETLNESQTYNPSPTSGVCIITNIEKPEYESIGAKGSQSGNTKPDWENSKTA